MPPGPLLAGAKVFTKLWGPEELVGSAPLDDDGVPPQRNRAFLRKSLGKHLLAAGKMFDYLDRFPEELTVIR